MTEVSDHKLERISDIVELEPTSNGELGRRWSISSGKKVHRYLKRHLSDYYYRDKDSYILATNKAEQVVADADSPSNGGTSGEEPQTKYPELRSEMISEIQRLDETLYRLPYPSDINKKSGFSAPQYFEEFEDWDSALEAAGIDKGQRLLMELERVVSDLGEFPTASEMNSRGSYTSGMYTDYFGSWSATKESYEEWHDGEESRIEIELRAKRLVQKLGDD